MIGAVRHELSTAYNQQLLKQVQLAGIGSECFRMFQNVSECFRSLKRPTEKVLDNVKHQTIPSIPKQNSWRVDLVRGSSATAVVDAICRLCLLAATVDGAGSWPAKLFDGTT